MTQVLIKRLGFEEEAATMISAEEVSCLGLVAGEEAVFLA
jgi:hypothetical protein